VSQNPPKPEVLARLAEHDEIAAEAIFADMCRRSPALRVWLVEGFGRSVRVRAKFVRALDDGAAFATSGGDLFARLHGEDHSLQQEQEWQRRQMSGELFGGLTWDQVIKLIRRYQAGALDLGTFMLAHGWRKAGESAKASPSLMRAGMELLDAVIHSRQKRLLKHLAKAVDFLATFEQQGAKRHTAFGYTDWWKLCALFYMLRHPRESYRTREVRRHLATLGLEVSRLDFQRFCKRHGIRRDTRGGRPRTRSALLPA
jgi:hypothetical protein